MSVILPRGSKIPIKAIKNFVTTQDYQTKIKFEIYEGERKITKLNNLLCEFTLKNFGYIFKILFTNIELKSNFKLSLYEAEINLGNIPL